MDKIARIRELVGILNDASRAQIDALAEELAAQF